MQTWSIDLKVVEMHKVEVEAATFEEACELAEARGTMPDEAWKTETVVLGGYARRDEFNYQNA